MESLPPNTPLPDEFSVVLETIARETRNDFEADFVAVWLVNPFNRELQLPAITNSDAGDAVSPEGLGDKVILELIRRTLVTGRIFIARVNLQLPVKNANQTASSDTCLSKVVFLPLYHRGRPLAVVCLCYMHPYRLTAARRARLQALGERSISSLQNLWLLRRYREVVRIGQEINQHLGDPGSLFQRLAADVSTILDTSIFFMLALHQSQTNTLDLYMIEHGKYKEKKGDKFEGASARVVSEKRSLMATSRDDLRWSEMGLVHIDIAEIPVPESLIFVPLMLSGVPHGILTIQHTEPGAFDEVDLQVMELLGNQVALAVGNLRLFQYLDGVDQTARRLTQQLDSEQLLQDVVEQMRKITGADIVTLYPYVQATKSFEMPLRISGVLIQPNYNYKYIRSDDIARLALSHETPVFSLDSSDLYAMLGGDATGRLGAFEKREQVRSTAVIPLRLGDEAVGVLFINYRQPQPFDAPQRKLIQSLAGYAAIAIKNSREVGALVHRRISELILLRKIDQEVSRSLDLNQVLTTILVLATQNFPVDNATAYLYEPRNNALVARATAGLGAKIRQGRIVYVGGEGGLLEWAFVNKKPVLVGNVSHETQWRPGGGGVADNTQSILAVPLLEDDDVIGILDFESQNEDAYSQADLDFLVTLANQAVYAIKNAEAYEREKRTSEELTAIQEVERKIVGESDFKRVAEIILDKALELTRSTTGRILFRQAVPNEWSIIAARSVELSEGQLYLPDKYQIVRQLIQSRRLLNTNTREHTWGGEALASNVNWELAVPMIEGEKVLGIIDIGKTEESPFDVRDERLLTELADLAVIAFQNTRNYALAQSEWKRFRLLWQAGRELSEIAELSQLESAYEIVVRNTSEDNNGHVYIRRYDENHQELVLVQEARPSVQPLSPRIGIDEGVNGLVARERGTVVINNPDQSLADGRDYLSEAADGSLVVAPILFKECYYGNLVVSHESAGYFNEASVKLIEGLAQQLAITIYRLETGDARRQVEQRAKDLEMYSQIGQLVFELMHRISNDLGLIGSYVSSIRASLAKHQQPIQSVEEELDHILKDVGRVMSLSRDLGARVSELSTQGRRRRIIPVQELLGELRNSIPPSSKVEVLFEQVDGLSNVSVIPDQIISILYELVTNAIEATPKGGSVRIKAADAGSHVSIEVTDSGPGVPADTQANIFNLFYSTKARAGFGLWSARRYALANGGDLALHSHPGEGATFSLLLPAVDATRSDDGSPGIPEASGSLLTRATESAQLAIRVAEMRATLEKLEERDSRRTTMLALAAHELRQPLVTIKETIINLLDGVNGPLSDKTRPVVMRMRRQIETAISRINNVLARHRIETGKLNLNPTYFDIKELISEVEDLQRYEAEKFHVELSSYCETDLFVVADRELIQGALANLVDNAIKFNIPADGKVVITASRFDEMVQVSVEDTGKGIAPEELEHIFEWEYQGGSDRSIKKRGLGLGLGLVKHHVELHGGTVQVSSTLNRGSVFVISLPIRRQSPHGGEDEQSTNTIS